ncbi:alpha/beta fold hydrolase [Paracoccus sp. Z330]|uniref:Proline iminopeptidase n=1 Tax=Paracoccus onchidii TaxID=3017813 RepID=A0ABT4ZJZ1_9RHOB|nr:alpha/beta fold hydrolase [Paracoccus onchidii]MDB6179692.1 alpha/beta fold hydrolase [Paracoccus onchidii]
MRISKFGLAPLVILASTETLLAQETPRVTKLPECFVELPETMAENSGADCGYVTVRENRSDETHGEIDLAYMRIRAVDPTGASPLFMLAGGPGQTMIKAEEMALFQSELIGPVLQNRDVVLLEQRGTFRSKPALTCPETRHAAKEAIVNRLDSKAAEKLSLDAFQACIDRHTSDGVDLASYNTVESAADVDDARAALGYDKFIFYGSSYGTLLGQFVMREFPESLAAVILDGIETPTTKSWTENRTERAQWGLDSMTELCMRQKDCAATFDIPALVEDVFGVLGDEPVIVSVTLPDGAPATGDVDVTVRPEALAATIYGLQTSKYGVGALPSFLQQQISAGRDALARVLAEQALNQSVASLADDESGMPLLMHLAMVCSDDPPRPLDKAADSSLTTYAERFGRSVVLEYVALCDVIDVPELSEASDEIVRSDVPVLALTGGLDVQTPAFLADEALAAMPNVTHVVFPSGFHAQVANLNRCAISMVVSFIEDPTATPDTGCTEDEADLFFVLPEN